MVKPRKCRVLILHLGLKTSVQASGRLDLLPPMYNTCNIVNFLEGFELMTMSSTRGKVRMVKAMTGRAMPRIRLLKAIYVQKHAILNFKGRST